MQRVPLARLLPLTLVGCLGLAGCGPSGPKMHPVEGRVLVSDGEVRLLAGSYVELLAEEQPEVRASGRIDEQGAFQVQMLRDGKVQPGVVEGNYRVRVILGDEGDEGVPPRRGSPVHPRFFSFDSSGLKLTVPSEDYTLRLSRR